MEHDTYSRNAAFNIIHRLCANMLISHDGGWNTSGKNMGRSHIYCIGCPSCMYVCMKQLYRIRYKAVGLDMQTIEEYKFIKADDEQDARNKADKSLRRDDTIFSYRIHEVEEISSIS